MKHEDEPGAAFHGSRGEQESSKYDHSPQLALALAMEKAMTSSESIRELTAQLSAQSKNLESMFNPSGRSFPSNLPLSHRPLETAASFKLGAEFPIEYLPEAYPSLTNVHSARALQGAEEKMSQSFRTAQKVSARKEAMERKGLEAQIEAVSILHALAESQKNLTRAMESLLEHSIGVTNQQAAAAITRDLVEESRSAKNTKLSMVAAWSGVAALGVGVLSLIWQVLH